MEIKAGYAPSTAFEFITRFYYENHGAANPAHPPLVLLHGGGGTIGY